MHSFNHGRYVIHHNGDYSGDAIIILRGEGHAIAAEMEVPVEVLTAFVASMVRDHRLSKLEDELEKATPEEILGIASS